jgi:hypothetical protein
MTLQLCLSRICYCTGNKPFRRTWVHSRILVGFVFSSIVWLLFVSSRMIRSVPVCKLHSVIYRYDLNTISYLNYLRRLWKYQRGNQMTKQHNDHKKNTKGQTTIYNVLYGQTMQIRWSPQHWISTGTVKVSNQIQVMYYNISDRAVTFHLLEK